MSEKSPSSCSASALKNITLPRAVNVLTPWPLGTAAVVMERS